MLHRRCTRSAHVALSLPEAAKERTACIKGEGRRGCGECGDVSFRMLNVKTCDCSSGSVLSKDLGTGGGKEEDEEADARKKNRSHSEVLGFTG